MLIEANALPLSQTVYGEMVHKSVVVVVCCLFDVAACYVD